MYQCEKCGGTFEHFKAPGQCPLCKVWAIVRCQACNYTADAKEFINNNDSCPKCGAKVSVPGTKASSRCFVATVAFADPDAAEVRTLRLYRDQVLSQAYAGRVMIRAYYRCGPFVASVVSRSRRLRSTVRAFLCVAVKYCRKTLSRGQMLK